MTQADYTNLFWPETRTWTVLGASCPDSKIVLMGYSQGAQVVGDVLNGVTGVVSATTAKNSKSYIMIEDFLELPIRFTPAQGILELTMYSFFIFHLPRSPTLLNQLLLSSKWAILPTRSALRVTKEPASETA